QPHAYSHKPKPVSTGQFVLADDRGRMSTGNY
ncbi:hypothetical protein KGM_210867B, partial [Danaus plexippus plexippus]